MLASVCSSRLTLRTFCFSFLPILNSIGLEINEARPHDKLPYKAAWLWVGSKIILLLELPNPDPLTGRPEHGSRDRHTCIAVPDVSKLKMILDKAGNFFSCSCQPQIQSILV